MVSRNVQGQLFVVEKLKHHRLKPGGVQRRFRGVVCSCEVKHHRLKPGGVQERSWGLFVAVKLKHHRLKPGGVREVLAALFVAVKLKHHRLKPGGVRGVQGGAVCSCEIEAPPAEAWWCPFVRWNFSSLMTSSAPIALVLFEKTKL